MNWATTGRLPKPLGQPTPRVVAALRTYDRITAIPYPAPDQKRRRKRLLGARLDMLLDEMDKGELAHYYAGVQRRLKANTAAVAPLFASEAI